MRDEDFFSRTDEIKIKLYRIAYGYFQNQNTAVDVLDEAIFKAYKAKNRLRQEEFFETWIIRILLNECNREFRRNKREYPVETIPETEFELFDALPLKEAIRKLPEELRNVIILHYIAGYTIAETAEKLEIPQGTAATRSRKAIALLKLDLKEENC